MRGFKNILKACSVASMSLYLAACTACSFPFLDQSGSENSGSSISGSSISGSSISGSSISGSSISGSTSEHSHTLVKEEAKEATCLKDGNIEYWYCTECGKYFSDANGETEIKLEDTKTVGTHSLIKVDSVVGDCSTGGNIEYWYCSVCEKYFADENGEEEITPEETKTTVPHSLVKTDAVDATCTEDGNIEYWTCSVCENIFSDEAGEHLITLSDTVIPASHNLIYHAAVAPTWAADGNIEYWSCSECGKYFSDADAQEEIEADDVTVLRQSVPTNGEALGTTISTASYSTSFWHIGSSSTSRNLGQGWYTFSSVGDYGGGTGVPVLVGTEENPEYLEFTTSSRFELFHVKDDVTKPDSVSYCHLADNTAWNNDAHAGLYNYEFVYSFNVSANGAYALGLFGMSGGRPDVGNNKDGEVFFFDGNTIYMKSVNAESDGNMKVQVLATLPETFDFGDGDAHNITFAINRYSKANSVLKVYIDGYMVQFTKSDAEEVAASVFSVDADGSILNTGLAYGFGQRFSVIPQINSEEGAEETTYSTVRIYSLDISRINLAEKVDN